MKLGDTPAERVNSLDEEGFEYGGMLHAETIGSWGDMDGMIVAVAEGATQGYKEVQWLLESPKSMLVF